MVAFHHTSNMGTQASISVNFNINLNSSTRNILVKESQDLTPSLLPPSLFMCHNTIGGTQNNLTELPGWQKVDNPLLNFTHGDVKTGGDDTALVQAAIEFDDDLLGAVIIDDFKFSNVAFEERKR